jgi:hypothetical protein
MKWITRAEATDGAEEPFEQPPPRQRPPAADVVNDNTQPKKQRIIKLTSALELAREARRRALAIFMVGKVGGNDVEGDRDQKL